jgi:uncharacterized membrane protein (UPF0127 family)
MKALLSTCFVLFLFTLASSAEISFSKKNLRIENKKIKVEIADTPERHERGLMFRKSLKDDEGMLFIFDDEEIRHFWMKNTFVDLDIGYFDHNKVLVDIAHMKAVKSEMESNLPTYPSAKPAQYALEVPKGWFDKHKIKLGQKFKID